MRAAQFLSWIAGLPLLGVAAAQARPMVVELFTSEGCSSCPPAEALLGQLGQRSDVIAVAFHVDYWDGLGWTDRFGFHQASVRQARYAKSLRLPSVYTPQVVVDGKGDFLGTDQRHILAELATARAGVNVRLAVVGSELAINVGDQPGAPLSSIFLAAVLPQAQTAVPRGENAGHTLTEFDIVRGFRALGSWQGQAARLTVPLSSLPADATRAVLLVQQGGQGAVLGAAVIDLK